MQHRARHLGGAETTVSSCAICSARQFGRYEHLRRAYSLRSDPEIAVHLGEVLWQKGQKADAQKLWREARDKDPKNDTLKSTLARLNLSL